MIKRSLWLTASLPILVAARNCTVHPISDDEAVGWQPGGCYRGTWNIVSTCLSTIIACTWSIQHLNIPATDDSQWEKNKRKMKWMIITVFFPELVLIHAMFEFHMAWKALRLMSKKQPVEWPWWFRNPPLSWLPYCRRYLKAKHPDVEDMGSEDGTLKSKETKWTLAHCYFVNMGGFICTTRAKQYPVTAQQLAGSRSYACPEITKEEIQDKSKQDWLAKLFAALQILQLILSIITRHIQGVQFSQLETVTLSFAICGVLVYCTYFHKPQKIELAIKIEKDMPTSNKSYDSFWAIMLNKETDGEKAERKKSDSSKPQKAPRIPNDNIPVYNGNNEVHPAVYLLALASGIFGAIHAIAWNFEFPTEVEKLLWKIATCISAASPVVGLLAIPFAQFTKAAGDPELFAVNCLRLMQEYSWHVPSDTFQISNAIKELEDAIAKGQSKKYLEIFSASGKGDSKLIIDLQDFLDLKGNFENLRTEPFELHEDKLFVKNFRRLVKSVRGENTKKIDEAAWTTKWPRKSLLPRGVNQSILYSTGFLYCASRLIILGVSFSSLRKMPGSVYFATNWTEYMPTFGAMGG